MFIVEKHDYDEYILNKQASFFVDSGGYIIITSANQKKVALHRLIKGLEVGDGKVGRHRVEGAFGLLDLRKRVLRTGNHARYIYLRYPL